ncbi:uncharacterized protein LOC131032183 isoform X1 [Cryptomeria japonica]|uniref:uncharacterized protein LOC131032183 isoform X1 n=1 Tax=Cryptomeria japonica TaxID=3369 RepID=UPI0027D9FCBB|nr:uncharacterized protein LOC131032183 isoform X1 [Cryptomeria japonica]
MADKNNFKTLISTLTIVLLAFSYAAKSESQHSQLIHRFQQYLQINTAQPTPNYMPAVDFILLQAKSIGLDVQVLEYVKSKPVILLTWQGKAKSLPSILLNSHTDVVPAEKEKWVHEPFSAHKDSNGDIYARGSQDMKCVGLQYLEALRNLKDKGFVPLRTIHVSFVPDEEILGRDGAQMFVGSKDFDSLNVGVVLDEGLASPDENYRVFYGERSAPWWLVVKAVGAPGHGSKLYDNSAMENLLKSVEIIMRFRAAQFDLVKAGLACEEEVISVNPVFLKAGTPTPTGFVMNLQPSEAEAGFDIRLSLGANAESLEKRIAEEWAPASRNMTFQFKEKEPIKNKLGVPLVTVANHSNPWWTLLEAAILKVGGKLHKPEIFPAATDARFVRRRGIAAFGFSPMANTPILLHDHNEFLNEAEYLKGVGVYEAIIESYASYMEAVEDRDTLSEL